MNTISYGDVYFLKSPFKSTVSPEHAKHVSYMLGTVSARPVVVVREPFHWDTYMDIEVAPAVNNENAPGIKMESLDRYGYKTGITYNFTPHTLHSIPPSRLGRYVGRFNADELAQLDEVMDWVWSRHCTGPIPECYKDAVSRPEIPRVPMSDSRDHMLMLTADMVLYDCGTDRHSAEGPKLITTLDIDDSCTTSPVIFPKIHNDSNFHPKVNQPAPLPVPQPICHTFPPSIFDKDVLVKHASNFRISESISNRAKPPISAFTSAELANICGTFPETDTEPVFDYYTKMTPYDVFILGVRLPTHTLIQITGLTYNQTRLLKCLCNLANTVNYPSMGALDNNVEDAIVNVVTEALSSDATAKPTLKQRQEEYIKTCRDEYINKLRPYLSETKILTIPESLVPMFFELPMYIIKANYRGKKFTSVYKNAMEYYHGK